MRFVVVFMAVAGLLPAIGGEAEFGSNSEPPGGIRGRLTAPYFVDTHMAPMRSAVFNIPPGSSRRGLFYRTNDYLDNPSFPVDRATIPQFAPIGELEARTPFIENGKSIRNFGTAVIVSPCYILTDAHVVLGEDMVAIPGRDYSMTFRAGVGKGAPFLGSTVARLVLSSERGLDGGNDWALMKLDSCVGKRAEFGWFEPASQSNLQLVGEKVISVGYAARDERGQLTASWGVVMSVNRSNANLRFSASMTNGQSGGPVLVVENDFLKLAGLSTFQNRDVENIELGTFKTYSEQRANEFQNAAAILYNPDIKAILDTDKAGIRNPASDRMAVTFSALPSAPTR